MNEYQRALMDKPDCDPGICVVCGNPRATNLHHAVERSAGGKDGPKIRLCGSGTTGCHGEVHAKRIHFRWHDGWWQYKVTGSATKYEKALASERGWRGVL